MIENQVVKTLQKAIRDIYLFVDDYPHAEAQHKAEIAILESYLKSAYEQGCLAKEEAIIKLIKKNTNEGIYRDGETAFDIVRDIKTL